MLTTLGLMNVYLKIKPQTCSNVVCCHTSRSFKSSIIKSLNKGILCPYMLVRGSILTDNSQNLETRIIVTGMMSI